MEREIKLEITITIDEEDYEELGGDIMEHVDGVLSNCFSCAMVTKYSEGNWEKD